MYLIYRVSVTVIEVTEGDIMVVVVDDDTTTIRDVETIIITIRRSDEDNINSLILFYNFIHTALTLIIFNDSLIILIF